MEPRLKSDTSWLKKSQPAADFSTKMTSDRDTDPD